MTNNMKIVYERFFEVTGNFEDFFENILGSSKVVGTCDV